MAESSLPDPWSEGLLRGELKRRDSHCWIGWGTASGVRAVVAFLLLRCGVEAAEILSVAVREDWRRCGVGRALVERALEETHRAGLAMVQLEVRAANRDAVTLYQAVGFVVVGRRSRYYRNGEDALLMTRNVEEARS